MLRWLTVAYKQKRSPRAIASDIEGLLTLGRNKGLAASLLNRLISLALTSDLYRLTYAIEQLKSQGRINATLSDRDWGDEVLLVQEYSDTDALLVRKSALTRGFSDAGKFLAPVELIVTGDCSAGMDVFLARALSVAMPEPGRIAIQP